jgi:hypothetical protein
MRKPTYKIFRSSRFPHIPKHFPLRQFHHTAAKKIQLLKISQMPKTKHPLAETEGVQVTLVAGATPELTT